MTKDEYIFRKMEMGCWHIHHSCIAHDSSCQKCRKRPCKNPDFTTWEGCGRLLDYLQTDPRAEYFCEILRTEQSLCCLHEEHIPLSRLKPVIIRDKLADFLGWEGE